MALVNTLHWRYATKQFDSGKRIDESIITDLLKGMNLAPSSYGLQPYEFVVISNKDLQEELMQASYGQVQIRDASHVIVLCAKTNITPEYIDQYVQHIAKIRSISVEDLREYRDMMIDAISQKTDAEVGVWARNQCYLVLGVLMSLCTDMHIDSCPMEGFISEKYNQILNLEEKGLHATLVIPIGYRSSEDAMQHMKKVRRELDHMTHLYYG